jgi:hypothetical protein
LPTSQGRLRGFSASDPIYPLYHLPFDSYCIINCGHDHECYVSAKDAKDAKKK